MSRKEAPYSKSSKYRCKKPPCVHVVIDDRRKIFKVFIEDYDYIIPIEISKIIKTCKLIETDPRLKRYREALEDEIDYLARRYLEAEPLTEEE